MAIRLELLAVEELHHSVAGYGQPKSQTTKNENIDQTEST